MTWGKDWGVPECSQTKCWSTKKMYSIKSLHRLTTSTAHQTNLTQNGSHFLPAAVVSYQ